MANTLAITELVERIVRNAPERDREMSARMAREFRGAGGAVFISHAMMRDLHDWLDAQKIPSPPTDRTDR